MRPLQGELLLQAWERGAKETVLERALTMLSTAGLGRTREELAGLSIAERDLQLLRLRQMTFGDALRGSLPCASCATRLEFEISVASMLDRLEALHPVAETRWSFGPTTFSMRPVTSRDLAAVAASSESESSGPRRRQLLLASCTTVEGPPDGESALADCEETAVEYFNRINEGAETRFTLPCPACGATDHVDLDIAQFLWAEMRHAAVMMLREVHELASAYGWSEGSILEMSAARRASYLELARA